MIDPSKIKLLSLPKLVNPPPVFDWRDNNGNWMTPVKNQGTITPWMGRFCGSCWDFAAVGAVEAWWKIHHAKPDSQIDLSEQFILSCSEAGNCDDGSAEGAYEFIRTVGVPSETCFPYMADDTIPCDSACAVWELEAVTIPGWEYITWEEAKVENLKSALFRRPVAAWFLVFQDFLNYSGGVYEHVWGNLLAGHYIVIVGWNDYEQSWICKNSWASSWGDRGYFRIKWGECEIGTYCPYIWDNQTGGPALATTPNKFDLSVVAGDSLVESLTIHNLGAEPLEYSTLDVSCKGYFHPDSFMSFDGLSWWCGDPQIGGYQNSWLECLDTPVLDLSITSQPRLSCTSYWAVEGTAGIVAPYDGWDGCNVWVSTDGGQTFGVAEPIKPNYTSRNLYSFGGWWGILDGWWGKGEGIPGWGGSSSGWQEIEFDLSSYRSDSVVVRFVFASDAGMATPDNPQLHGFFVDDIAVTDGGTVLFEDHGNDASHMFAHGETNSPADWMDVVGASGTLAGGGSAVAQLKIGTRGLEPGEYRGGLLIFSNDTTAVRATVPVELQVLRPEHDVAVQSLQLPCDSIPLFIPIKPSAEILNCGQNDGKNFDVTCTILHNGQSVYHDTTHVSTLSRDQSCMVEFKPFVANQKADHDFVVTVLNFPNDHNAYNNSIHSTVGVTNLVDNFEGNTGYWIFADGWGITKKFAAHSGRGMAHVNNGITPYGNNMDATMIFAPGFRFQVGDSVTLKYWTAYATEEGKDVCYVEASVDSLSWIKLDSLSGTLRKMTQQYVSLTRFIAAGHTKVWIRFHFISDAQNTNVGVVIDDVGIDREHATPVIVQELAEAIPTEYRLEQNYPNPFNPSTSISYQLSAASFVDLSIYNSLGQKAATLVSGKQAAGYYKVVWDASGFSAGVYFCRLEAGEFVKVIKLALVR